MIRGMTLVTTALIARAAKGASATPGRPTSATPGAGTRDGRTTAEVPATTPAAAVVSLSVVPTSDRADVVIGVDGPVEVHDFTLPSPNKIVVDITGASLGIPGTDPYDRIARAGIVDVRYSQYRKNVVRVVLTLELTVLRLMLTVQVLMHAFVLLVQLFVQRFVFRVMCTGADG